MYIAWLDAIQGQWLLGFQAVTCDMLTNAGRIYCICTVKVHAAGILGGDGFVQAIWQQKLSRYTQCVLCKHSQPECQALMGSYGPCGSTSYPGIRNLCYDNTGAGYLHVHLHQNTRYQKGLFTKLGSKEDQELEKLINQPEPWSTNQVRRAITHTHTHTHTHTQTNKQTNQETNTHARAHTQSIQY